MLRFKYIFVFAICCFWSEGLLAQQDLNNTNILSPAELLEEELINNQNNVLIQQIGNDNKVNLNQQQEINNTSNVAKVLQTGDYNIVEILQNGGNNQIAILQKGDDNVYRLDLNGTDSDIAVIQRGDNNSIVQELVNTNNVNVEFLQLGNDNEIEQVVDGISTRDYKIYQIGDGMRVIVRQSSTTTPNN